jgi:uncharacterized membrane protein YgdD (TMEM256/DUF423 family)
VPGKFSIALGSLLAAAAVALGAFGAHGLKPRLESRFADLDEQRRIEEVSKSIDQWHTGAHYHFGHAGAMVLAGAAAWRLRPGARKSAVIGFVIGILLFSGGLYLYVLGGPAWIVHVVPIGGLAFIFGWIALAAAALSTREHLGHRQSPGMP